MVDGIVIIIILVEEPQRRDAESVDHDHLDTQKSVPESGQMESE